MVLLILLFFYLVSEPGPNDHEGQGLVYVYSNLMNKSEIVFSQSVWSRSPCLESKEIESELLLVNRKFSN